MDCDAARSPARPLLLLGRSGEALAALSRSPALRTCFVVSTPPDASVEDLAAALKPTAVLLEATEFYLEGRRVPARLLERSRSSRIVFLDLEQGCALWMEVESEETGNLLIAPCVVEEIGETLLALLSETAGPSEAAEPDAIRLGKTA